MSTLPQQNPIGRFTGLADCYAKNRPGYPASAVDFIMQRCALNFGSILVDIGCGTGISSRVFAERGVRVIGIEPNSEMREKAGAIAVPAHASIPIYQDGRAEATGLPSDFANAVVAAQAFHWFLPEEALREFHRILKPGAWALLLWNERDSVDRFTAMYGKAFCDIVPEAAAIELPRANGGYPLLTCPWFENRQKLVFHNEQVLDEEGLLGRAFSASYAPRDPPRVATLTAALRKLFAENQKNGKVCLQYDTLLYLGRKLTIPQDE